MAKLTLRYINILSTCPYCSVVPDDAWVSTDLVVAIPHPNPLTACHIVIAPRRHVPAFYDLDVQEQRVIWNALAQLRRRIAGTLDVESFDAGFVDAPLNGDTEFHTHVHLVPRVAGQRVDLPRDAEWVNLSVEA
jgi:diadenosine tetraphosphate (Ap4A) HIT family hydrolase